MCGIYGMVGAGAETVLPRMSAALVHRGPDGDGWAVRGAGGVGCRRLAIIDVAGGAQPLANETGDVIVVCNGEIYNSAPLRSALQSRGHRFRTRSDAEVLPHLYEDEGLDFVHALDGMFALALWDARRGRLVLARDRMGEKPVYHATTAAGFLFASEPKALLASGHAGREPDWTALAAYLRTGYVPNPASAFAAIQKVPPGGRLVLEGESARADRYWEVAPFLAAPPLPLGLDDAAAELRAHLVRAVRAALVSDVPLGVFLSGGLDSTAVTAVTRSVGGELNTFALGFAERGFDERDHASRAGAPPGVDRVRRRRAPRRARHARRAARPAARARRPSRPERDRRPPRPRPDRLPDRRPPAQARPRQHGRLARGPRAVPRPPAGRVRLSPADRAQGARPRDEAGAA